MEFRNSVQTFALDDAFTMSRHRWKLRYPHEHKGFPICTRTTIQLLIWQSKCRFNGHHEHIGICICPI